MRLCLARYETEPTQKRTNQPTKKSEITFRSFLLEISPTMPMRSEDFGAFFGNKSDPYVVVRFGAEEILTCTSDIDS